MVSARDRELWLWMRSARDPWGVHESRVVSRLDTEDGSLRTGDVERPRYLV